MNAVDFRADLDQIESALNRLADSVADGSIGWPTDLGGKRLLLTGMGSSYFAADVCARRLRVAGLNAVAELASVVASWPPSPDLVVIAISANGGSGETLAAVESYIGISQVIALTNRIDSELGLRSDLVIDMCAGVETGGVACRSFRNTIGSLLALEARLVGGIDAVATLRRAAAASTDLLNRSEVWLPPVLDALASPDGAWFLAPAERLSSALQGALMVREGPRRWAAGCETGDWNHVDVYLTKTLDYRAVVFTGSRYDAEAARWMSERGSTSVAVGGSFPGARYAVRYSGDHEAAVALLTEPLVAELTAYTWWAE